MSRIEDCHYTLSQVKLPGRFALRQLYGLACSSFLSLERYEDVLRHFDQVLSLRPHMSSQIVALQVSIYEKWSRALAEEFALTGAQDKLHRALQFSPRQ